MSRAGCNGDYFHRSTPGAAAAILAGGFDDTCADPNPLHWVLAGPLAPYRGVWLSSHPLAADQIGVDPETHTAVLRVALPTEVVAPFEQPGGWYTDAGEAVREWCVPTAAVNAHGKVSRCS
jgi:hypothetical protein